jgi:hypothetical protein
MYFSLSLLYLMLLKRLSVLVWGLCIVHGVVGQTYRSAVGLRLGDGLDITAKGYVVNNWTVEAIGHTSLFSKRLGASLLAEKHHNIFIRNFNVYYGGGAHYYFEKAPNRRATPDLVKDVYGLSVIGGAELSLGRLNFSVDVKPEIHLGGDQTYPLEWTGVSVSARWIIERRRRSLRDRFDDERDRWRDRRDDRRRDDRRRWRD